MRKSLFLVFIVFLVSCSTSKYKPVNKNASPEAKELLEYLYSIQGKKIISGQHNYVYHRDTIAVSRWTDTSKIIIGKYPAIWGCDFSYHKSSENRQKIVDEAIKKHKEGFIITLMYHQVKPMFSEDCKGYELDSIWSNIIQGRLTDDEWNNFLTPGTNFNKMWLQQIDTVAFYLKQLRDANIPVLWRPYHEMNGIWFWWGNRPGSEGYSKLWKTMFDRYIHYHQLNNLIWVWNANAPRDKINDEAYAYELFFPGIEYVDVLAADVYHNDYKQSHHDQLLKLGQGKLIALGEVGEMPSPDILSQQPQWSWFMVWTNYLWRANTQETIMNLYDDSRVLTKEEIKIKSKPF